MRPEVIYPLIAMFLTAVSVGGTMFFNRHNAKRGDIEILKKDLHDQKTLYEKDMKEVKEKLLQCEIARENLTRDRLILLEQVAFGDVKTFADKKVKEVQSITSPQVHVEAVE